METTLEMADIYFMDKTTLRYFLQLLLCCEKKLNHTGFEHHEGDLFSAGGVVQEKELELVAREVRAGSGISSPTSGPPKSLKLKRCYLLI